MEMEGSLEEALLLSKIYGFLLKISKVKTGRGLCTRQKKKT
jgi:hypothetical protein